MFLVYLKAYYVVTCLETVFIARVSTLASDSILSLIRLLPAEC